MEPPCYRPGDGGSSHVCRTALEASLDAVPDHVSRDRGWTQRVPRETSRGSREVAHDLFREAAEYHCFQQLAYDRDGTPRRTVSTASVGIHGTVSELGIAMPSRCGASEI